MNSWVELIHVLDDGLGIPSEQQEQVLRAFSQINSSRRNRGGFGLGLAIVKRIMTLHKG